MPRGYGKADRPNDFNNPAADSELVNGQDNAPPPDDIPALIDTIEHRRFCEFANAVREDKYIGLCYGAPSVEILSRPVDGVTVERAVRPAVGSAGIAPRPGPGSCGRVLRGWPALGVRGCVPALFAGASSMRSSGPVVLHTFSPAMKRGITRKFS
jgi:hypothetical protein